MKIAPPIQNTISINQLAAIRSGFDLDIVDLAIFDLLCVTMGGNYCSRIYSEGDVYFYASHQFIINALPILGIKTSAGIIKHINKLIAAGALVRHPNCEVMKKTYYKFGPNYDKLRFTILDDENANKSLDDSQKTPTFVEAKRQLLLRQNANFCQGEQMYNNEQIYNKEQTHTSRVRARRTSEESCQFADSRFADYEKFAAEFSGPDYADIDISYYYNAVADWSARSGKKQKDWIATARSFMRRDNARGELKKKASMFKGLSQDAIDYLKSMQ